MNEHLSASQRRILRLEHEVAVLKQMQGEYGALLNYLCRTNGGYYHVSAKRLASCEPFLMVRTEITKDENSEPIMEFTLVQENGKPKNLIIL